jgi:hypothetical protein
MLTLQSTPEYARSGPTGRKMDSFERDTEWRRGVDEQLSYTVSILKQVLERLDQPHLPVAPTSTPCDEPKPRRCPAPIVQTFEALVQAQTTVASAGFMCTHLTPSSLARNKDRSDAPLSIETFVEDTVHVAVQHKTALDLSAAEGADVESEEGLEATKVSEEMQRVLRGEDPDFQAPKPVSSRASRSRAQLAASSPKVKSKLKRTGKRGTPTLSPLIPPSNPGRLDPRPNMDAVPVGKPCWILHPDFVSQVVGYGKTGPHWKSKGQCLAAFCSSRQQMVQVHGVFVHSVPLMVLELDRQPFHVLDDAVTPTSGFGVHMIWETRYVVRYNAASAQD